MVPASDAKLERADAEVSVHVARHADHQGGPLGDGAGEHFSCLLPGTFYSFIFLFSFLFSPLLSSLSFPFLSFFPFWVFYVPGIALSMSSFSNFFL